MRKLVHAVLGLLRRSDLERDLDDELAFHVDMAARERERRGVAPGEARRQALAELGGVESTKEAAREARAYRGLEVLLHDTRYALRGLRRSPGYAAAAGLALALGIGANTAIFSLVRGVLLRPLPYGAGDRLVIVHQPAPRAGQADLGFSVADLEDFRSRTHAFDGFAEYHGMWFNLLGHGEPERVSTGVVSANYFDLLGVEPVLGRSFRPADEGHLYNDTAPVLLLSYEYWQRRFGGDPAVVGQVFEMNDHPHTVIGVLPPVPGFPNDNDVWMPTNACPFRGAKNTIETRQARGYFVFARLRPGVTLAEGNADLAAVAAALATDHPQDYPTQSGYTASARPLKEELVEQARPTLLLLQVTVALVLLIVCANVANLQLARLSTRREELAVRSALGAGRRRLLRQVFTESLLVSLLGAALGAAIASGLLHFLVRFAARFTHRASEIHLDGAVLLFTVVLGVATGLAAGTLPAFAAAKRDVAAALGRRGGNRGGPQGLRLRAALSALQVAISFALLVGAGLTLRSVWQMQTVDAGFDPHDVLAVHVDLDFAFYKTPDLRRAFYTKLLERARSLPGVNIAAISSTYPLDAVGNNLVGVIVKGEPTAPNTTPPQAQFETASPGFFQTVGIRLLRGRAFGPEDRPDGPPTLVINQALAKQLFGNANPIGQQIALGFQANTFRTVVGVVADARSQSLAAAPPGTLWTTIAQQAPLSSTVLLRGHARAQDLVASVRNAVLAIDPRQPIGRSETLEEARAVSLSTPRLTTVLLALFAGLALVVTIVGLGGVVAYGVAQRTHEIGVRMALGARRGQVLRDVAREGLVAVACGLAAGAVAAALVARLLTGSLFGVTPSDPLTYLTVAVGLLLVAMVACLLPARRAAALDPALALRTS
jgi:predicted permease